MSEKIEVELVPHDPSWATMARVAGDALRGALGNVLVAVEHIGSTSIPGIKAKPIIDLIPLVSSLHELDARSARVTALGYEWRGEFGIAGRRYCPLNDPQTGKRLIHAHFYEQGAGEIERHLTFRDYLRAHADEGRAYEAQKQRAAALHPDDSLAYNDAKDAWIKGCEARALAWAHAKSGRMPG